MKKYIVTTTINEPTKATLKFINIAEKNNWTFVIVGDTKTPHTSYQMLANTYLSVKYLHPDKQKELYPELSDIIGWRTIQRRNIGLVYAYKMGANVVATVDDDNIPYDNWGTDLYIGKEIEIDTYETESYVFDPFSVTNQKHLWHRGFPIELVPYKNYVTYVGKTKMTPLIQADFWDGDPDIDAMARLAQRPLVKFDHISPFRSGDGYVSPFNSQNTFLHRKVLPYYAVLPFVGRMDDIWGGYLAQRQFPNSLIFNRASVYQDRNIQDLVKNLEDEIIGYRNTYNFILETELETIETSEIIPEKTKEFYRIYQNQFK